MCLARLPGHLILLATIFALVLTPAALAAGPAAPAAKPAAAGGSAAARAESPAGPAASPAASAESPPAHALAPSKLAPSANPAAPSEGRRRAAFSPLVERWRALSRQAARVATDLTGYALDEDLLLALVAVESGGQPEARSARGAVGLTQLEPATFADLQARYAGSIAPGGIDDPRLNLEAGSLYLAECARLFDADLTDPSDLSLALNAYNLGPHATVEALRDGGWLPAETVQHAARIIDAYRAAHA